MWNTPGQGQIGPGSVGNERVLRTPQVVDMSSNTTKPNPIYLIYTYKDDLALNYLLIWHKAQPKSNQTSYLWSMPFRFEHRVKSPFLHISGNGELIRVQNFPKARFDFLKSVVILLGPRNGSSPNQ